SSPHCTGWKKQDGLLPRGVNLKTIGAPNTTGLPGRDSASSRRKLKTGNESHWQLLALCSRLRVFAAAVLFKGRLPEGIDQVLGFMSGKFEFQQYILKPITASLISPAANIPRPSTKYKL